MILEISKQQLIKNIPATFNLDFLFTDKSKWDSGQNCSFADKEFTSLQEIESFDFNTNTVVYCFDIVYQNEEQAKSFFVDDYDILVKQANISKQLGII